MVAETNAVGKEVLPLTCIGDGGRQDTNGAKGAKHDEELHDE